MRVGSAHGEPALLEWTAEVMNAAPKVVMGVTGGWLAIMAPAVVTIALRLLEFDPSGLPTTYAMILALGWLSMIVALIVSGSWSDATQRRLSNRASQARIAVPLIAVGGALLAIAPSPAWLAAAWVVVQIPSAIVLTAALAEGGELVMPRRRGLTSGLVGAAPILALLLGSIAVRMLSDSLTWAFVLPAFVGALVATPLMYAGTASRQVRTSKEDRACAPLALTGTGASLWIAFLFGSFLLAWSTATTNGFLVTFVQYVAAVSPDEIGNLSSLAVISAAVLAVVASVAAGVLTDGRSVSLEIWLVACAVCSVALAALILAPSTTMLMFAASLFGMAFGAANGVEFSVVLLMRRGRDRWGRDFGLFTAATSAPYVLVPAIAAGILSQQPIDGTARLFTLACATAAMGAAVVSAGIIIRGRRARHVAECGELPAAII